MASTRRTYVSPTREENAARTREAILDALSELLVTEGPAVVSIPAVARRARVSVRTVYHHFPTKESLFEAARQRGGAGEVPAPASPAELMASMRDIYAYLSRNTMLFEAARRSEVHALARDVADRGRARMQAVVEPLRDRLDDDDAEHLAALLGALTSFDVYRYLTSRWGLPDDEAADLVAWAVRTLTDRVRRTGRVDDG